MPGLACLAAQPVISSVVADNQMRSMPFKAEAAQPSNVLRQCAGSAGLAHVRYPTAGSASAKEAQPFFVNSPLGIFMIHNGNLTNTEDLRQHLQSSTSYFNRLLRTPSDSEVLLNVFADDSSMSQMKGVWHNAVSLIACLVLPVLQRSL